MDNHELMLNAFVENVRRNHQDDVGLVVVYGSYVNQTMHELSDIDVMFVGKTDKAYQLEKQFIYEGIGYDFFCIPIERLHRIIDEYQPLISIIAEGRLLYSDSAEKGRHFADLQKRLKSLDMTEPVDKYFHQVESLLNEMKVLAFDHATATIETKRHIQGKLIYQIMHYIQLINRRHFQFGTKRIISEIQSMALKPKTTLYFLELLTKDTVQSSDIAKIVQEFVLFYLSLKTADKTINKESFYGFYEEEISTWNKLIEAVKNDNIFTAYLAATSIENELIGYRRFIPDITNLFTGYNSEAISLLEPAEKAEKEILKILKDLNIPVNTFDTLERVIEYISKP